MYTDLKDLMQAFLVTNKPIKQDADCNKVDVVDMKMYREEVKQFVRRKATLRQNLKKSYGLVWGQYFAGLQTHIQGITSYQSRSKIFDVVWLLQELKKATSEIMIRLTHMLPCMMQFQYCIAWSKDCRRQTIITYQGSSRT